MIRRGLKKVINQEGWIYTGDLAVQDQDGLVFIKGRADNMFISGGEKHLSGGD
jgi:fatty-acyl-CoA synthase